VTVVEQGREDVVADLGEVDGAAADAFFDEVSLWTLLPTSQSSS
jgi:hypothetical protein